MREYDLISADSHVVEPHDLWAERVPKEFRDRAPRLIHEETTDVLECDQTSLPNVGLLAGCYHGDQEQRRDGRWDEDVPRAGYDPDVRIKELARDGVDAEVLFPTLGMPMYPIDDLEFKWALFRAYNDWLAEVFCQPHPDRFFGLAMLTNEDVPLAVAELKRAKSLGLSGVMLPLYQDHESPYYDERYDTLWAAAVDYEMPINLHQITSRKRKLDYKKSEVELTLPPPSYLLADSQGIQGLLIDLIAFGVFDRFPQLKVVSAENDAGWAGYLMQFGDYHWHRISRLGGPRSKQEPSTYFSNNIRMTFMRDRTAILAREVIGLESLMWGSDFPHLISTFPRSKEVLDEHFHDQPQAVRDAVVRDNVRALYNF